MSQKRQSEKLAALTPSRRRPLHHQLSTLIATLALVTLGGLVCGVFSTVSAQDKKLKAEDLVAHHLEAIGSAEARAAAKTRVVSGSVKLVSRIGSVGNLDGQAMMVSAGTKLRYGMSFPAPNYPGEQMAFDGTRLSTGFLPNGVRSNLSLFLTQQEVPLKESLIGGVLATGWPLLRIEQQQPKLEYHGLKKVDGRPLHELAYRPRKGSADLKVLLYFDPETFRHVRTRYSFEIGARLGAGPNESGKQQESYYVLTEDFDDFRAVDGLTLPHKYKLQLSVQTALSSLLNDWTLEVSRISHKESFDDQVFTIK